MGSSLSERFGLFIQNVYGYCSDLSEILFFEGFIK